MKLLNIKILPEWNDAEINGMQWQISSSKNKSRGEKPDKKLPSPVQSEPSLHFEDEAGVLSMPKYINVAAWVRPQQFFGDVSCSLLPETEPLELIPQNSHLMSFDLMRYIITSIMCLEREAYLRPFPIEFQSSQFIANGGQFWKPWHHVYSLSKVGQGTTHNMHYNSYGKYIVRLFYLGKWRQILVDDTLPVDENENLLLPCSKTHSNIWLPILCKGLIRVAEHTNFRDFNVVQCLTGWFYTSLDPRHISPYCLWYICCQLMSTTKDVTGSLGCCREVSLSCLPDPDSDQQEAVGSRSLFIHISHLSEAQVNELPPFLSPCLDHFILVESARFNDEQPNPRWKEYRWKEWAFNKGLISDIKPKPVRNVQLFCPFQKRSAAPQQILPIVPASSKKKKPGMKMKNTAIESNPILLEKSPDKEERIDEWTDFDQLIKYLKSVQVFYKPSFFEYQMNSYNVDDLSSNQAESKLVNETSVSKSTSKAKDQSKTSVKHELKASAKHESRNKLAIKGKEVATDNLYSSENNKSCFYFISDSPFCKTFYFTASSLESENGNSYFYVIGEKFNWRSSNLGEIVFVLKSKFLKSIVLKLGPGLQLLRVWFKFPKSFSFHIYSSTAFTTCNKFKMQEILACDSLCYNLYGNQISDTFKILLESCPGGQEHGESYTNFIHSFNPPQWTKQLQWPFWFTAELDIQNIFEECIIEFLVKELPPSEEFFKTVEALKMIFLSPKFGDKAMEVLSGEHSDYFNQQKLLIGKSQLESAEKLTKQEKQSKSKKGDKGKSSPSLNRSDKSTKPSAKKTESSKKSGKTSEKPICLFNRIEVPLEFLLLTNSENAKKLMRLMMQKLPQMLKYYPLKTDYIHHLVYHDYVGECNVYNGWVLFYRCLMNLHTNKATACGFHLMTEISKVITHVIDMDTLNEIYLGLSENTVCTLSRNTKGYLVCAYGKMKNTAKKTIPWKLRIIGEIDVDLIHPCLLDDPDQCVFEQVIPYQSLLHTDGYYIPNRWNIIGRCLIEVKCGVNVLLRLALSGYNVQCLLKLDNVSGKNVVYVEGESEIILPSVYLEGPLEGDESALYEVEVKLINDSWPLTNNEKEACYITKETIQDHLVECCEPRYSTNTSECLIKKGLSLEKNGECWWEVIIVCEEAKVNLFPDKRIFENLHEYIQDWSIKEGSRLKRGLVYRNKFRASFLKEETDDIKIIETAPTKDLFNLNQIRITNLLKEYDEPEYEAFISSFQDDCLSEKELIEAQEEVYTDIIMQRQKRLHSTLAQYTKEENVSKYNFMGVLLY